MRKTQWHGWKVAGVVQTILAVIFGGTIQVASPAQEVASRPSDHEQFRRTVDPSGRGPFGTLVLRKNGSQQTVQVLIQNLATSRALRRISW